MIKGLLVPNSGLVEDKYLLTLGTPEDQFLVKHRDIPQDAALDVALIDFLERMDVDEVALDLPKKVHFEENHLFGMW